MVNWVVVVALLLVLIQALYKLFIVMQYYKNRQSIKNAQRHNSSY